MEGEYKFSLRLHKGYGKLWFWQYKILKDEMSNIKQVSQVNWQNIVEPKQRANWI
jgi:hypothetical protein